MPRSRRARGLAVVAQLGHLHWFYGNLYEAIVRIPSRLSTPDQRLPSTLAPGSPARYHLPVAPLTVGASVAAAVAGRRDPARGWLAASAGSVLGGAVVAGYLVSRVNPKLIEADTPALTDAERAALLRRWYRLNAVRIAAAAVAWLTAERARRR